MEFTDSSGRHESTSRRKVLGLMGVSIAGGVAGCAGSGGTTPDAEAESTPTSEPTPTASPTPSGDIIDFTEYEIQDYLVRAESGDEGEELHEVRDGGTSLFIKDDAYKMIETNQEVTNTTTLTFTVQSDAPSDAQILGIGFDDNRDNRDETRIFQLAGLATDSTWTIKEFNNYADTAPDAKTYTIPVGDHYTGNLPYLVFVTEDEAAASSATFSNVRISD